MAKQTIKVEEGFLDDNGLLCLICGYHVHEDDAHYDFPDYCSDCGKLANTEAVLRKLEKFDYAYVKNASNADLKFGEGVLC